MYTRLSAGLGRPGLVDPSMITLTGDAQKDHALLATITMGAGDATGTAQLIKGNQPTSNPVNPTQTGGTGDNTKNPTQTNGWDIGTLFNSVPWLTQSMVGGIPNWGLLVGGLAAMYMFGGSRR